jgi:uncharacterized membrane protein
MEFQVLSSAPTMKKITLLLLTAILGLGYFFSVAQAQGEILPQEAIVSFSSNIIVNVDNSIDVTETIIYNTGPQERHGIYRGIYPYSSQKRKMAIENVSVTNEQGVRYQFQRSDTDKNIKIKIGDPNQTFSGQKIYVIKYRATKAIAQFNNIDEIYWNATGAEWGMPIYRAQASIVLPSGTNIVQSACYYGPKGSTTQCSSEYNKNGNNTFSSPSVLSQNEGMTVALGFSKGIVIPYPFSDTIIYILVLYLPWIIGILLPVLTFVFSFLHWYKKGRDARETGTIVPQYDIPNELTPIEVAGIINERVSAKDISAQIVYLATKGYLKIQQIGERASGLFASTDYELVKLKDFSDLPNDFDKKLLHNLFNTGLAQKVIGETTSLFRFTLFNIDIAKLFSRNADATAHTSSSTETTSVKLSDLKDIFYQHASTMVASVRSALLTKGYYSTLGGAGPYKILLVIILIVIVVSFSSVETFSSFTESNSLPIIGGVITSVIIYGIFLYVSPSKTEKGVIAKEYLLGLKDYLQIAEKDRLQFHNTPERKLEVFEKLLPYAMVLGVADIWTKEFEGIYTTPPSWYSGPSGVTFNAGELVRSMNSFSSSATSSLSSMSQGSGGGGSSGGGGGGGGGGSW